MVPRSFFTPLVAFVLLSTSMAAPAAAPEAVADAQPVATHEHRAARYARSFIYERRQVPQHPSSTLKERDVDSDGAVEAPSRVQKRQSFPQNPHPDFTRQGPISPQPSSGFGLPALSVKERRDAPYSYLNKRDPSAFAYPDHGYEGFYRTKRQSGPPAAPSPALPQPSSGFHLPQMRRSENSAYSFGQLKQDYQPIDKRSVKGPTRQQAAKMPVYAMGY